MDIMTNEDPIKSYILAKLVMQAIRIWLIMIRELVQNW